MRDLRGLVDAELGDDVAQQADHPVRGHLEAVDVEDLRADVAVQPDEPEVSVASTRRTASIAAPPASEKPNFWSSCAVAMNSWVCASTPTVTRIITSCTTPSVAGDRGEPGDLVERVEDDVPDPGAAPRCAARPPTCCCRAGRSARPGSRRAARPQLTAGQTSSDSPSSATQRTISLHRNAFDA